MKRICTLILAAGLVFGAATGASAIDFKAKGQWLMGFAAGNATPVSKTTVNGVKSKANDQDTFEARFNCINVGENSMQPRPIRLRLANDQLYFRIDDGPEQGPYRDCGPEGINEYRLH